MVVWIEEFSPHFPWVNRHQPMMVFVCRMLIDAQGDLSVIRAPGARKMPTDHALEEPLLCRRRSELQRMSNQGL
jgi:hypothetical protein